MYTQGGSYGPESSSLPSWAHREPSSYESSSHYPVSSQYQPGGQMSSQYGSHVSESSYGSEPYGVPSYGSSYGPSYGSSSYGSSTHMGGSFGSEPYGVPRYGTPSSYGPSSYGPPSYGPSSYSRSPYGPSSFGSEPYGVPSYGSPSVHGGPYAEPGFTPQGGNIPEWARHEPRGYEQPSNYPVSSQYQSQWRRGPESSQFGPSQFQRSQYGYPGSQTYQPSNIHQSGYGQSQVGGYPGSLPSWAHHEVRPEESGRFSSPYQTSSYGTSSGYGQGGFSGSPSYGSSNAGQTIGSTGSSYGTYGSTGWSGSQSTSSLPEWARTDISAQQRINEQSAQYGIGSSSSYRTSGR